MPDEIIIKILPLLPNTTVGKSYIWDPTITTVKICLP